MLCAKASHEQKLKSSLTLVKLSLLDDVDAKDPFRILVQDIRFTATYSWA